MAVISATCGRTMPGQRGDLAGVVHAHFEHCKFGVARHSRQAQRHAGVVVVALDRAMHRARPPAVERGEQALPWSLVLPTEPVTPMIVALDRARGGPAERLRAPRRRRRPAHAGRRPACDTMTPAAPAAKRAVDELMPVVDRARHGDEQVAGLRLRGCRR